MSEEQEQLRHYGERLLTARYNFWCGSLTAQAVFASVAVALVTAGSGGSDWRLVLLGAVALTAMALLLLNFAMTKSAYELIGKRIQSPENELSESGQKKDIRNAGLRHTLIRVFEWLTTGAFIAEIALLFLILVGAKA